MYVKVIASQFFLRQCSSPSEYITYGTVQYTSPVPGCPFEADATTNPSSLAS